MARGPLDAPPALGGTLPAGGPLTGRPLSPYGDITGNTVSRRGAGHFGASAAVPPAGSPGFGTKSTGKLAGMFNATGSQIGPGIQSKLGGVAAPFNPANSMASASPTFGTQSGPTAVEDRYNQRANGTDPGWEYATGRASDAINKQYAARGGYNSSGAMQSLGDMFANATSQREGQLDTLSNQATQAHQNALNGMFTNGLSLANGESGAALPYDTASGTAQGENITSQQSMTLAKYGIDAKTAQALVSSGVDVAKFIAGLAGNKAGGK